MAKKAKITKAVGMKRIISSRDSRLCVHVRRGTRAAAHLPRGAAHASPPLPARSTANQTKNAAKGSGEGLAPRNVPQVPTALFFRYNTSLGPPYQLLLDTNFINFSIKNKLDIVRAGMDCLLAKVVPCVTECVLAELEKLGPKYRVALRIAKDPRFERIPCEHRGTYADDCLVNRVTEVSGAAGRRQLPCTARRATRWSSRRVRPGLTPTPAAGLAVPHC